MKIYLTKLEIPQLIKTAGGYMVFHLYEGILSLFEFELLDEAEKTYQNALMMHQFQREKQLKSEIKKAYDELPPECKEIPNE